LAGTNGDGTSTPIVEAVVRAFRLLDCFRPEEPELSLNEFVRRGGYSKTTTYRLLMTLQHVGWLERTENGAYRLTIKPFRLGAILVDGLEIRREAGPVMAKLAAEWELTVYLIVPAPGGAVCLERIDSGSAIRVMALEVGGTQPYHLGAGPRVLLAYDEEHLFEEAVAAGLEQATPDSITDVDALKADLAETRRRGYSVSVGDMTSGIGALAAPIHDRTGAVVATISVAGLVKAFEEPRQAAIAKSLVERCGEVSARLGYRAPASADQ
jgi:DNA-binding IclR family transcriptional regulator